MKAYFPMLAILALAGCDSPEKRLKAAEDRLVLMEKTGASKAELCEQHEKVYQAALDTGDASRAELPRIARDTACVLAQMERRGL